MPPDGNTPTGVGKTGADGAAGGVWRKHPHGRGEDVSRWYSFDQWWETPPRAWGRRPVAGDVGYGGRNTPTGVGKTYPICTRSSRLWKHPHGRGEDDIIGGIVRIHLETPPRAWGRHRQVSFARSAIGNTPTGVGKTFRQCVFHGGYQKHPHGRGEDSRTSRTPDPNPETPPRAWGRRFGKEVMQNDNRNTPTGVGKTEHSVHASIRK